MKLVAVVSTILAVFTTLAMFASWTIATWHPWGHSTEWARTGGLLLLVSVILAITATLSWDSVKR